MAADEGATDLCMSVRLDNRICNVLVSSQTTGEDVIDCLRPEDDKVYCLVEVWKGCERPINKAEKLENVLLQWGSDLDDVTFMLKEKLSRKNSGQKNPQTSPTSAVQFQDHLIEQQRKVEHMERELQEKEQYLQALRLKEAGKNSLKTNYVRRLEARIIEQEQQLRRLRRFEQELFKYHIENEKLALELHRARSMFTQKQQELAEATARIELLTRELSLKQRGEIIDQQLATMKVEEQKQSQATFPPPPPQHQQLYAADQSVPAQHSLHGDKPVTEKELLRLKDQMLQNKLLNKPKQAYPTKDGTIFNKNGMRQLNDDDSVLSWQDDDENDTETSADSGHVSVDSPSYQSGGVGLSFDFNDKQKKYLEKVERFDMELEYSGLKAQQNGLTGNSLPRTNPLLNKPRGNLDSNIPSSDFKQPLFVRTDLPRTQSKQDSPTLSTSSLSSQSSQLSAPNGNPEVRNVSGENTRMEPGPVVPVNQPDLGKDRTDGSISRLRKHNEGRLSPRVNDPSVEPPVPNNFDRKPPPAFKRTDSNSPTPKARPPPNIDSSKAVPQGEDMAKQKQPVPSVGIQDLLSEVSGLKVSTRDTKAFQIQTVAEKDSVEKNTNKTADNSNNTNEKSTKRASPRPVPRKRTKKPPARSIVVTSMVTTERPLTPTSEVVTAAREDSRGKESKETALLKQADAEQKSETKKELEDKTGASSVPTLRKGNGGNKKGKRVSLDPHAVLLHASLDGELDVIKSVIHQVEDPSFPNTEGLTALHHAVCNNHADIVEFLIEYGCDINAADMQGWTSLHCAAANNNIEICTFLVSNGACTFAVTAIEGKTPSRCCEKDTGNYKECFTYLFDLENTLGITNEGIVYAVYAYQATRKDELSFECGERMAVIRRGDVTEKEWWWARDTQGRFGYIPRNLLGLSPRIAPDV